MQSAQMFWNKPFWRDLEGSWQVSDLPLPFLGSKADTPQMEQPPEVPEFCQSSLTWSCDDLVVPDSKGERIVGIKRNIKI